MKLSKKLVYPWIVVLCCCAMSTASIGITINCMGVYYAPIAADFGVGLGSVSLYLTILNLTSGVCGPLAVKLTRKFDIRLIVGVGGFGSVLVFVGLANINALWQVYALALVQGFLCAMHGMVLVTTLVSNWFSKAMGIAAGLSLGFSGLMGAVLSPVFNSFIQNYGWRTSYLIGGALTALCIVPTLIFARLHPADIGLPRFGEDQVEVPVKAPATKQRGKRDSSVFRSVPFLLITGLGSHVANYAASTGAKAEMGALMISAVMVGNMLSKFAGGALCDILRPKKALILIWCCTVIGLLMMLLLPGKGMFVMLMAGFLLGTSYSIASVALSTMCREIFGIEKFASAYSYSSIAAFVGSAVAITLIGYSYDIFASFAPALIFCTAIAVMATLFVPLAYRHRRK